MSELDLIPLKEALIRQEPPPESLGEKLGRWEKGRFNIYSNPIEYAKKVYPKRFTKLYFMGVICIFYPNIKPSSKSTPRTVAGYYLQWLMSKGKLKREGDEYLWVE